MLDYGMFEFAAPPFTGAVWVVDTLRADEITPYPEDDWHTGFNIDGWFKYRVSLVRHPVDWLHECYLMMHLNGSCEPFSLGPLARLDTIGGFKAFVERYLGHCPGAVGRVFAQYRADSCLRLEDMPWALIELLKSFGKTVSQQGKDDPASIVYNLDGALYRLVMRAESEVVQRYDYF